MKLEVSTTSPEADGRQLQQPTKIGTSSWQRFFWWDCCRRKLSQDAARKDTVSDYTCQCWSCLLSTGWGFAPLCYNFWTKPFLAIERPPRSPDLTLPDFFLWEVVKEDVFANKYRTIQELKEAIVISFRKLSVDSRERVCRSVIERLEFCKSVNGGHIEHLLK